MSVKTLNGHIEITKGIAGGKPRISRHRITVQNIVIWHELLGYSAEEIAADYELSLADVYAALAYYHDNREQIDNSMRDQEAFVEELRRNMPSKIAQKLNEQKD